MIRLTLGRPIKCAVKGNLGGGQIFMQAAIHAVIRLTAVYHKGAVYLLGKYQSHELMGIGHRGAVILVLWVVNTIMGFLGK